MRKEANLGDWCPTNKFGEIERDSAGRTIANKDVKMHAVINNRNPHVVYAAEKYNGSDKFLVHSNSNLHTLIGKVAEAIKLEKAQPANNMTRQRSAATR